MKKIPIYLSAVTALVVLTVGLLMNKTFNDIAVLFIIVVAASYIVGLIVRNYLSKNVFPEILETDEIEFETEETAMSEDEDDDEDDHDDVEFDDEYDYEEAPGDEVFSDEVFAEEVLSEDGNELET